MATSYANRFNRPLGAGPLAHGGASENMGVDVLQGESEMVTVFDDFNDLMTNTALEVVTAAGATGPWDEAGWVTTEDAGNAAVADLIGMNDGAVTTEPFRSSIRFFPGTADDSGGNMQLDVVNSRRALAINDLGTASTQRSFPHIWIPETAAGAAILDNTSITFACRCGFQSGELVDGDWEGKVYIGWAEEGAAGSTVMDHDTGVLTTALGNLHGFHIGEDGAISGVSKRITGDAIVEGTNNTIMQAAGAVDGTVANGAATIGNIMWWDLALRMDITNQSDNAANGSTQFFSRRCTGGARTTLGAASTNLEGNYRAWTPHTVDLDNQTPNHSAALVPTIEVMNGPTGGDDIVFFLDWWSMGISRQSWVA